MEAEHTKKKKKKKEGWRKIFEDRRVFCTTTNVKINLRQKTGFTCIVTGARKRVSVNPCGMSSDMRPSVFPVRKKGKCDTYLESLRSALESLRFT